MTRASLSCGTGRPPALSISCRFRSPDSNGRPEALRSAAALAQLHLQFAPLVINNQHIEQPKAIHADQNYRIAGQVPVLEDAHVAKRHVRADDLDATYVNGRHRIT